MSEKTPKQIEWVKLAKYCQLTGETRDSVMKKRASGKFLDGVHSRIAPPPIVLYFLYISSTCKYCLFLRVRYVSFRDKSLVIRLSAQHIHNFPQLSH